MLPATSCLTMPRSPTTIRVLSLLLAGVLSATTARAGILSDNSPAQAKPSPCVIRYDALLLRAKQALRNSDRAAALELLLRARELARTCPEFRDQDSAIQALASNTLYDH
jgi:hypothetical protein